MKHPIFTVDGRGRTHYPFRAMGYGDHIIVPKRLARQATAAAYMYGLRHRITFTCTKFGTRGRMKIRRLSNQPWAPRPEPEELL